METVQIVTNVCCLKCFSVRTTYITMDIALCAQLEFFCHQFLSDDFEG